ncbi:MAG TPA: translation initiation factor IF-2 subunit alpha [Candidatus Acidoferrales bacterium]|nr:translation initiation factor IF-2 subunit alpha [Candidatus Acidoferrales bacterium]
MSTPVEYPEVGDLVVASVTRVVDYGAYVKLDEYEGVEGLIHISEIASTYVKNIRVHVREGQKLVLKVLRVSTQRSQVDLSLRRVTGREKSDKMLEWKKVKKADSIIKGAAERLQIGDEEVNKIRTIVSEKFDNPFDGFEDAADEGEETFTKLGISEEWAKALTEVARSKIKLEKARVTGTVELTCTKTDGIEAIRQVLHGAKKVKKSRGTTIKVYTIGSPKYRLEVRSKEITDAQATLNLAIDEALSAIKDLGGEGRRLG